MTQRSLWEEELLSSPIRSLQYMLRQLSRRYPFLPTLVDSGIFDEATLEAVMRFQKELHPPVTGVVDLETWEAIYQEWERYQLEATPPYPLRAFPEDGRSFPPDFAGDALALPQMMFQILSQRVEGIQPGVPDGVHDSASVQNVRWLQQRALLPTTGVMDRATWEMLRRLYELLITHSHPGAGQTFG